MPEEKKYINGIIIKEKVFDNGGKQLKVSIAISDLIRQLSDIKDRSDSDWANLIIARRREPSDKGSPTMSIKILGSQIQIMNQKMAMSESVQLTLMMMSCHFEYSFRPNLWFKHRCGSGVSFM